MVGTGPSVAGGSVSGLVSPCSSVSISSSVGLGLSSGSSDVELLGSGLSSPVGCAVAPTPPSVTAGEPLLSHISGVGETATSLPYAFSALSTLVTGSRRKVRSAEVMPYDSCCARGSAAAWRFLRTSSWAKPSSSAVSTRSAPGKISGYRARDPSMTGVGTAPGQVSWMV